MACLPVATQTLSGLLEVDVNDGEVELMRRGDVELRSGMTEPMVPIAEGKNGAASALGLSWIDRDENIKLSLTTHRLVFFQESQCAKERNARFLPLSNLHWVERAGGGSGMIAFSSPKIALHSYLGDLQLIFRSSGASKDRDDLLKFLQKALDRKAWEVQARLQQHAKSSEAQAKRKVGVVSFLGLSWVGIHQLK